jgi:hypothetical protein
VAAVVAAAEARGAQLGAAEVVVAARAAKAAPSALDQHCSGAARSDHVIQSAHLLAQAAMTQQWAAAQAAQFALQPPQALPPAA